MGLSEQYIDARKSCWISGPNYSTDWNWLMPVVEKIESEILDGDVCFDIDGYNCFVSYAPEFQTAVFGASKIEAVFEACVEFAKWYKNQPK